MAKNATPATDAAVKDENAAVKATIPAESVYTAEELAQNHKAFNTSYEIVAVALRLAKKERVTFTEAKNIIEKFKNKEVK